jgi:hypothetical protein
MSKAIEVVKQLVDQFTANPKHVEISHFDIERSIQAVVNLPKNNPPPLPACLSKDDPIGVIAFELLAGAVNYCYWYGAHDIRPNDTGATKMYQVLANAWESASAVANTPSRSGRVVGFFLTGLSVERFPLMSERAAHLKELGQTDIFQVAEGIYNRRDNLAGALEVLIGLYSGYAQDLFLKRASLFFMQVFRQTGLFAEQIGMLPVPADYQVPKMLHHFGILKYGWELQAKINNGVLIAPGSREECEIRASTIKACTLLANRTNEAFGLNLNSSQIDDWLWLNRKSCNDPFHLTVTSDY